MNEQDGYSRVNGCRIDKLSFKNDDDDESTTVQGRSFVSYLRSCEKVYYLLVLICAILSPVQ